MIHKDKSLMRLSDEEKRICQTFVNNYSDIDKTAKEVGLQTIAVKQFIDKSQCKTFINYRALEQQKKETLDYNYKQYKLKRVVDEFIPDDLAKPLVAKEVAVAISAIAESNKMVGDYAAEKHVNVNLKGDSDLQKVSDTLEKVRQLAAENKRDF